MKHVDRDIERYFDGGIKTPDGLPDAGGLPKLARALKKSGLSHDDVLKVFSLNALRVLAWRPNGGLPACEGAADTGARTAQP